MVFRKTISKSKAICVQKSSNMSQKNLSVKIPKNFKNNLKNKRINKIYKRFEKFIKYKKSFAVAVSGGAR